MADDLLCNRCGKKLDPKTAVWLEGDVRIGGKPRFDGPIPPEFSQGSFPYGKDCVEAMTPRCQEQVFGDWHSRPCGRPVVGKNRKGKDVCGIHLRQDQNRAKGDEARKERYRKDDEAKAIAKRLSEELGVVVQAQYVSVQSSIVYGYYSADRMIVPTEFLEKLASAQRQREAKKDPIFGEGKPE